ncbi:MAG: c-type cytochrome domain-containing protein [Bacteroidota bacterium]
MRVYISAIVVTVLVFTSALLGQEVKKEAKKEEKKTSSTVSFKNDVFPIINKNCLPCHAEENFNPSELSMDNYDLLKTGGKNGSAFIAGKSKESPLVEKLGDDPPFGDRMPLNSKKKIKDGKAKWLTDEEVKTIATWIDQGAKNN